MRILAEISDLGQLAQRFSKIEHEIKHIMHDLDRALNRTRWEGRTKRIVDRTWNKEKRRLRKLGDQSREIGNFINKKRAALERADQIGFEHLNGLQSIYEEFVKGMIALPVVGIFPLPNTTPGQPSQDLQKELEEARSKLEDAKRRMQEASKELDDAYERAKESYDRLKSTKGTEFFQDINKLFLKVTEKVAVHVALDGLKIKAEEEMGKAGAAFANFIGAAYYAWKIGESGAMALTVIFRNYETQWKTWAELLPARIRYEQAWSDFHEAEELVESLSAQ